MSSRIPRLAVEQRRPYLLRHVPEGARILHVGCTGWPSTGQALADGSLFHAQLAKRGDVVGIDISEPGLDLLREAGYDNVYSWDATKLSQFEERGFDCVVASDVIEHLSSPGDLLDGVASVLKPGGLLILSTVNAFSLETLVKLPFNWESVHAEHTCYFSYATLKELVSRYSFTLENAAYYHEQGWQGPYTSIPHVVSYAAMRVASFLVPHYGSGLAMVLRT